MKAAFRIIGQIGLLILIAWISNQAARLLHLPVPGSIIGLILTFVLLKLKLLRLEWIESGASFLLAELLLFFVPSAVGIISYQDMLMHDGISILLIVGLGTFIVMMSSGLLAQLLANGKGRAEK